MFKSLVVAVALMVSMVGVASATQYNLVGWIAVSSKASAGSTDSTINLASIDIVYDYESNCNAAKALLQAGNVAYFVGSNKDQFAHPVRGFSSLVCTAK